jgi:hypothetical protein
MNHSWSMGCPGVETVSSPPEISAWRLLQSRSTIVGVFDTGPGSQIASTVHPPFVGTMWWNSVHD